MVDIKLFQEHLDSKLVLKKIAQETRKLDLLLSVNTLSLYIVKLNKSYPTFDKEHKHLVWYIEATSRKGANAGKDFLLLYEVSTKPGVNILAVEEKDVDFAVEIQEVLRFGDYQYERQIHTGGNWPYFVIV